MTFRAEPTWGGDGAVPTEVYAAAQPAPAAAVTEVDGAAQPAAAAVTDVDGVGQPSTKDLESEVYTVRDVHGDDRVKLRRKLARARSSMTETSYRRALELARDSVLLTVDECLEGAQAMEWEPQPRPEFTLATIEAAVAEQERAEQVRASYERTEREVAEQARTEQARAEQKRAEQAPEPQPTEPQPTEPQPTAQAQEGAEQQPAEQEQAERQASGTSRWAG